MKIRLMGAEEENALFAHALKNAPGITINEISKPYKNRGFSNYERVYIDLYINLNNNNADVIYATSDLLKYNTDKN